MTESFTHPLLEALEKWLKAVDPWTWPASEADLTSDQVLQLVTTTRELRRQIGDLACTATGEPPNVVLHPLFSDGHALIRNLIGLSGSFLWQHYTDSDTDSPCDMEWDVHTLLEKADIGYTKPVDEYLQPAYVSNYYDGPEAEED